MTVVFIENAAEYRYEAERLCRCFFQPEELKIADFADISEDYCRIELTADNEIKITLCANGSEILKSKRLPQDITKKETEYRLSVLLYHALCEFSGKTLPWGILTGVRPVKVLSNYTDEQAGDRLLVSEKKLALARKIERVQKPLISSIPKNSFGLYVSIPFCPTRCSYCSFVSHSVHNAAALIEDYLSRLFEELKQLAEISSRAGCFADTIYIGGGTPTVLSAEQLKRLFSALERFDLSHIREFTVEAGRPDTITREKLLAIKAAGAERISVNPQTMNDEILKNIGRNHTSRQTLEVFSLAREVGFKSINADLIAGLPGDNAEGFAKSLDEICALSPENITVHSLSLKRASNFYREYRKNPAEDTAAMIEYTHQKLEQCGYLPYYLYIQRNSADNLENTGYSKPDCESLYNTYIMEEKQTILAAGAGAVTKLVGENSIKRIAGFKYPYEYINRFDEILQNNVGIYEFLSNYTKSLKKG